MFESLFKAALSVVAVPAAVVADVVTMGGMLSDKDETYTGDALGNLIQNLKDATEPEKK